MKRLMMILFTGFILLLSGCMKADDEDILEPSIYDYLYYDFDSLSLTNTSESDILYLKQDTYFDFNYIYNELTSSNLTTSEQLVYQDLFTVTDQIADEANIEYEEIINLSSSEFRDTCDNLSIEIGLDEIVSFNSLKELIQDLETLSDSRLSRIPKLNYIELRLDITLTNEEKDSLEFLQEIYNDLYEHTYNSYDFKEETIDSLLLLFKEELNYEPNETALADIEIAYDIISRLASK